MIVPTFAELWQLTNKVGRKELYAKRYQSYSDSCRVYLFDRVKNMKVKPNPAEVIK